MRLLRILLVIAAASGWAAAQAPPATGTLFGDVADPTGAPIYTAHVVVHSSGDGSDKAIAVDNLGRFSLPVAAGEYDVFVSAQGFAPYSGHFSVAAGKPTRVEARLKTGGCPPGPCPVVTAAEQPSTSNKRPRDFSEGDAAANAAPSAQTPAAQPAPKVREFDEKDVTATPESAAPAQPAAQTQPAKQTSSPPPALSARDKEMRDIAVRFSPVWYQRMAGDDTQHRFELCTVFDFDGDWVGNNNWAHAADPRYPIWAFTYYSVIETDDYYFLHYACYHPRDWSLVQGSYDGTLDVLQEKYKEIMNKGVRDEVEFNHENDLEGVLVIVDKWGQSGPQVVAAETVAHNHLLRAVTAYSSMDVPSTIQRQNLPLENGHPVFYIESQKHGIHPYSGEQSQADQPIVVLRYGPTTELTQIKDGQATFDLVPIKKTFYQHALETHEPNLTYGTIVDFSDRFCEVSGAKRPDCAIGKIGGALRGDYARPNAAVAPWVWFDLDDKALPPGSWFFDPATILVRHFGQQAGEKYLYNPYLGIDVDGPEAAAAK